MNFFKSWWGSMKPRTRQIFIIVIGAMIIASMFTGNFDAVLSVFK